MTSPIESDRNPKFPRHTKNHRVIVANPPRVKSDSDKKGRPRAQNGNCHCCNADSRNAETSTEYRTEYLCDPEIHLRNFGGFYYISACDAAGRCAGTVTVATTSAGAYSYVDEWRDCSAAGVLDFGAGKSGGGDCLLSRGVFLERMECEWEYCSMQLCTI